MLPNPDHLATRRQFFGQAGLSIGSLALASLLRGSAASAAEPSGAAGASGAALRTNPLAARPGHFPARAKRVIFMFMAGAPSQLELFDNKPKLRELHGKVIPESFTKGKRFAFIKGDALLLGPQAKFARHGESGAEISERLPYLAKVADEIAIVRSMATDVFNHGPAKLFVNTGSSLFGRPSIGAWVTYGIGSESNDLPGFVVLQSGPRGPRGGAPLWGSGFLPTTHQGVPFLSGTEPILNLTNPPGVSPERQQDFIDAVGDLNRARLDTTGDPEIATRIAAYEMAYRMQSSAPELMDLSGETQATFDAYGVDPQIPSYARNCLLARRLIERDVRFVQLYDTDWDDHGDADNNLGEPFRKRCLKVDQASAALVADLKQRGLLDDTLVIWGGEFGRTPMGEVRSSKPGRDHHITGYSMWLAGGGIKPGITLGATDEIGYNAVEDRVHVHDLQATILHLLGLDHEKLTFRFQGRPFRLTDVHGHVVKKLLA